MGRINWTDELKNELIKYVQDDKLDGLKKFSKDKNILITTVRSAWSRIQTKTNTRNKVDKVGTEIDHLINYYKKNISPNINEQDIEVKGIRELYFYLTSRKLNPIKYLEAAIDVFSRKDDDKKQTFGYFVSIVRNWAIHGLYYTPSKEDEIFFNLFEKEIKIPLSIKSKEKITSLVSEFGITRLIYLFGKEANNINLKDEDLSLLLVNKFSKLLEKY